MPRISGVGSDGIQAVVLALRILERLAEEGRPMGVTSLAAALDTTKSRIWRHLQTLMQQGYISQSDETERYRIGARLVTLGYAVGNSLDIVSAGQPIIRDLRDNLGHSTVISQVEAQGVRIVSTVSGKSAIEIGVRPGSLLDFHNSAQGKIALAFGSDSLRAGVFKSRLEKQTPYTITSPGALRSALERVRQQGWAAAPNKSLIGLNALGAPVFDAAGSLVGTVAIVDSVQFIPEQPTTEQIEKTVAAARLLSAALGYVLS